MSGLPGGSKDQPDTSSVDIFQWLLTGTGVEKTFDSLPRVLVVGSIRVPSTTVLAGRFTITHPDMFHQYI